MSSLFLTQLYMQASTALWSNGSSPNRSFSVTVGDFSSCASLLWCATGFDSWHHPLFFEHALRVVSYCSVQQQIMFGSSDVHDNAVSKFSGVPGNRWKDSGFNVWNLTYLRTHNIGSGICSSVLLIIIKKLCCVLLRQPALMLSRYFVGKESVINRKANSNQG